MAGEGSEEPHPFPGPIYGSDQEVIEAAVRVLREMEDTPLHQMTPLFYQHGYEELRMMTSELLRILGSDPRD